MVNLLTTFCYIAPSFQICGPWFLARLGNFWVMPKSVVELLVCWQGQFGRHRNGHIWTIIPHCRMWCIWRDRNRRSFEDTEHFMPDLKFFFFWTLLDWLTALRNLSSFSIVDLLDLSNFCNWLFHPGIIPV